MENKQYTLRETLRKYLIANAMTQKEFAERSGVSLYTISLICRGKIFDVTHARVKGKLLSILGNYNGYENKRN